MDHITHDEFAGRLEKIMEPLISRPSFKAKIAFFHGNVSSYNPYGTDRLHGAKAYIRALSKVLADPDKIDALNNKTPSIDLVCTLLYLCLLYTSRVSGKSRTDRRPYGRQAPRRKSRAGIWRSPPAAG